MANPFAKYVQPQQDENPFARYAQPVPETPPAPTTDVVANPFAKFAPTPAPTPTAQPAAPEEKGFISRNIDWAGDALRSGWESILSSVEGNRQAIADEFITKLEAKYGPGAVNAPPDKQQEYKEAVALAAKSQAERKSIAEKQQQRYALNPQREATQQFKAAITGFDEDKLSFLESASKAGEALLSNPVGVIADLGLESTPASVAMVASALLTRFGGGSNLLAAGAGGASSAVTEFGNEYAARRDKGIPHDKAWEDAATKSGVIGLLDAVSMNSAGKAAGIIVDALSGTKRVGKAAKEVLKETGKQAGLGAAGEAGGSLAIGEVPNPAAVMAEAVGEVFGAPLEAVGTYQRLGPKPEVKEDTPEARALRELDTLTEEEERAAEPRRPADLTPQEISNIERRLYAELGREPNEFEFEEAIDDYLDEQNAGRAAESGAGIAGISDISIPEAAGVPDTGVATTPESGRLGTTGGAAEIAGVGEGAQPGALEGVPEIKGEPIVTWQGFPVLIAGEPFTDEYGNLQQRVKFPNALGTFEGEGSKYHYVSANELEQFGEYSTDPEIAKLQMRERSAFGAAKSLEDQQKELLTKAGRKPAKNSPARKKYDELEKRRVEAFYDWVESERKLSKAQKEAAPKAEEVITKAPANVESIAASYADELFATNPDYDVAGYDDAEGKLFSALIDQGITGTQSRKIASKAFSDRLIELDEGRGEPEGGAFKSLAPTPPTYISPAVGIVPTNKFGINRLNKLYSDGKISAQEYADAMIKLYEELENKVTTKAMSRGLNRQRGLGTVIKALEDAVKKGRISEDTAEFAKWLLLQNPAIANDLAISISMPWSSRAKASSEGVAGFYNDMARLVRIITRKGANNKYLATPSDVAVHEILHHMERMLPTELRALIREEWKVRVQKAMDKAVKENNQEVIKYLALVAHGNAAQSSGVMQEAENMIKDGKVPHSYYGFMNTSEFWAVNGSNILAGRYGADTRLQKLRQYVKEFIEKIKSIFGLDTNDPIIKGLNAVLKGDGTFLQRRMLAESRGGQYSKSLSPEGWSTAETEISEDEKKIIEQFRRAGDLQPDVVRAILNNDLNGALNILAKRLTGFYGELATKLASLNLQTSIGFDNAAELTYRAVEQTVGPQLQRVANYIRVANPDFYEEHFKNFDRPENLVRLRVGINTLYFDTVIAKGKGKYSFTEIGNEIKDVSDAIYKYDTTGAPGAYYNIFDAIALTPKLMEGIGNRVFLHEVVHAATVSILRADPSQLTKEQLEAREEIETLYRLAQRNLKVGEYGLTNKFEFLAELFTNNDFRNLLKVIPYPPASTNVLSRFFNAILRLVGADNLASRAMVEASKLFTSARYQETKPMGPVFAQAPKKRRVRGPISTPDTYRTAETQQNTLNETLKAAYEGRMSWADAIKILGPSMWDAGNTVLRKTTLPVLNLTQLEDLTRTKFTQITGALKIIRDMVAYRAKKMNTASEIMRDWTKAQKSNFAQSQLMGRIMMEATIRGIDPDKAAAGALNKPLQDAWNTLKPEYKAIYRRVRDFYADSVNEMVREAKRRASAKDDPEERAKARQKIDEQFGADKLVTPYFPLRRFGQYWYQVGSGDFKEFYEFENPLSRDLAMRRRAQELRKGNEQHKKLARTMIKGNGISELYGRNISTTQALKDVEKLVDDISATDVADLKGQIKDSLNQLIYILLPQQSMRKMFINRKAIQGASADMLRVFATTAVHSAYQQARFMYSEKFLQNLNNARSEIDDAQKTGMLSTDTAAMYRDFIFEVEQRVPTIMSNEDTSMTAQVAGKASELTFYYMLSAPFTAMLNTIGAVQLAMPYIGGSYGYVRANALLTKNMGRYLATSPTRTFVPLAKGNFAQVNFPSIVESGKLPPLLQKAADRFIDDGLIDISLTNDIFELGERPSALYTGTAATVKKVMSGLFHQSERMNREIILLTSFELAYNKFLKDYQRQPGMEGLRGVYLRDAQGKKIKNTPDQAFELAVEEATRVASVSLGDYSRQTKGRIFANPIMNLLLKFKQYPILAMYSIMRNFHVGVVAPFKNEEINQYRELLEKELQNDPNKDQVIAQRLEEVEAQRRALEKEGRRRLAGILGVTTILGGVAASPFFSLVVGSLVKMFAGDDDDDYFDWENWFYNYMETEFGGYAGAMLANAGVKPETAEKAGRKIGEVAARGVPAAMGAALSDRVSLDPKALLWRDGRYSPDARENFIESLIANAGPVVGLGLNFADAYQLAKEGQYARAVEKAVPAIIAKPASALRMGMEGAKTKKGDVLINDFTATELAMQAIGLQPERLAQKQKAAIAMKQKEQKILNERSAIMDRLWMERDNDSGFESALDRASEFSRKHPAKAITAKNIQDSFEKRAKASAEAEAVGAKIDKKLRGELIDMGAFAEDEQ